MSRICLLRGRRWAIGDNKNNKKSAPLSPTFNKCTVTSFNPPPPPPHTHTHTHTCPLLFCCCNFGRRYLCRPQFTFQICYSVDPFCAPPPLPWIFSNFSCVLLLLFLRETIPMPGLRSLEEKVVKELSPWELFDWLSECVVDIPVCDDRHACTWLAV